jgi:branched-subunit amino acid transport protein
MTLLPAGETDAWTLAVIAGLTAVTVVSRGFFLLSRRALRLPRWAERGLRYAPGAALAAVIAPEIVTVQGHVLAAGWQDARLFAAAAGIACYAWRRSALWTIAGGMAVYLPLHLLAGW